VRCKCSRASRPTSNSSRDSQAKCTILI
jgi:hypothetical protein